MDMLSRERIRQELLFLLKVTLVYAAISALLVVFASDYATAGQFVLALPVVLLVAYIFRIIILVMKAVR